MRELINYIHTILNQLKYFMAGYSTSVNDQMIQ